MTAPAADAPFSAKTASYRTRHTSRGVRLAHMIGTPVIVAAILLLFARPRTGIPMFLGGWIFQIAGHKVFEDNTPSSPSGITDQLAGVIHVCEQYGELLARRHRRTAARTITVRVRA